MTTPLGPTLASRRHRRPLAAVVLLGLAVTFLLKDEHEATTTGTSRLLSTTRPTADNNQRRKRRRATVEDMDQSLYRSISLSLYSTDGSRIGPDREATMFFTHFPKSGGTNVKSYYACVLQPSVMILPNGDQSRRKPLYQGTPNESAETTLVLGKLGQAHYHFGPSHQLPKAKAFTMLRHPVDRMVSDYYYIQQADWEPGYDPDLANKMSLVEFGTVEHRNVLMRVLLYNETLTYGEDDDGRLQLAKEFLKEYYLVGLTDQMTESLRRFDAYFGIDVDMMKETDTKERYATCRDQYWEKNNDDTEERQQQEVSPVRSNSNVHPKLDPHGDEWRAIADANRHDVELYEHAEKLFTEQGRFFEEKEKKKKEGALQRKFFCRL